MAEAELSPGKIRLVSRTVQGSAKLVGSTWNNIVVEVIELSF